MIDAISIAFRPLRRADFPLMVRWLNTPHVREWWQNDPRTLDEVEAKYAPMLRGESATSGYVILHGEHPIGYIQVYLIADYPVYAASLAVEWGAAGVDLFIGDEA